MTEPVAQKKSKDRSPTFPFITLERAIERAREFYAEEKRGVAPYKRAVIHWKYSEASSGGLQTVAALKNYGLMSEPVVTGATGRSIQLTDLALRIILDQRPDSEERARYVREAAFKPAVAAEVYGKWSESLPSPATLNHFLMLEKKFTEETASKVAKILKENHTLARIGGGDIESEDQDSDGDYELDAAPQVSRTAPADTGSRVFSPAPATIKAVGTTPAKVLSSPHTEQHLHLDGKTVITLHFSDTPTSAVYEYLSAITAFKAGQLKAMEAQTRAVPTAAQESPAAQ